MKKGSWKKYTFEFLSIFIAVISAFTLNNWNENRRESIAEQKILIEIKNGLEKDIKDLHTNIRGHKQGVKACRFWRNIIQNKIEHQDSVQLKYMQLTRDFTSLQNISGYETLKSRGLELVRNDSLRSALISLYEYDYSTLRKLEENYEEMQFQKNYFKEINRHIAPHFIYDQKGNILKVNTPINYTEKEKNILMSYLLKIEFNRMYVLRFYQKVEQNVKVLKSRIKNELNR